MGAPVGYHRVFPTARKRACKTIRVRIIVMNQTRVKELRMWVTYSQRGMQQGARVPVADGKAEFQLHSTSFTTLIRVTSL